MRKVTFCEMGLNEVLEDILMIVFAKQEAFAKFSSRIALIAEVIFKDLELYEEGRRLEGRYRAQVDIPKGLSKQCLADNMRELADQRVHHIVLPN